MIKGVFLTPIYPTLIINLGTISYFKSVLSLRQEIYLRIFFSNLKYSAKYKSKQMLEIKSNCNQKKLNALKLKSFIQETTTIYQSRMQ